MDGHGFEIVLPDGNAGEEDGEQGPDDEAGGGGEEGGGFAAGGADPQQNAIGGAQEGEQGSGQAFEPRTAFSGLLAPVDQGEKEGGVEDVGLATVHVEPPMGAEAEKAGEEAAP